MSKEIGNSHVITSNQKNVHDNLLDSLADYPTKDYRRPIADYSKETFSEILKWLNDNNGQSKDIILDLCCGVGESSYHLGKENPHALIVGIDKSVSRLERNNKFKDELPSNVYLTRGELLDLWFLFANEVNAGSLKIKKQYILYPNPYPKQHHFKRRWHGNPIAPFIFQTCPQIEVRSNWKLYLEEFKAAAEFFKIPFTEVKSFKPDHYMTPFEKKYSLSGQEVYCVKTEENL